MTLTKWQLLAVKESRKACEKSGRPFAVFHQNVMGAGYALTFDRLKDCTEHARMFAGIKDTYARGLYGYSYKTGCVYVFGFDQSPFRFRAFRIN
jgi:hypothetical protein